jgi:hypothetical protein
MMARGLRNDFVTATAFTITALENGRHGTDRLDRRFVPARHWLAVEHALNDTIELGPLPADHPAVVALLPEDKRRGFVVQYLHKTPVADGPDVAKNLDALLNSLVPTTARQDGAD